jgi:hypothetical protein
MDGGDFNFRQVIEQLARDVMIGARCDKQQSADDQALPATIS